MKEAELKSQNDRLSTFEVRRRAPLHFYARAENAHFSAYILAKADASEAELAEQIGYSGDPTIASHEGFLRESAVALELIIKGLIAARIEQRMDTHSDRPPANHNVVDLWKRAGLPKLDNADQHRLHLYKAVLIWAGRYPAPMTDEQFWRDDAAMDHLKDTRPFGTIKLEFPRQIGWQDFDRIYQLAREGFAKVRAGRF